LDKIITVCKIVVLIVVVAFLLCFFVAIANASYPVFQIEKVVSVTNVKKGCSYDYNERKYKFRLKNYREIVTVDMNGEYYTYVITQLNYHTYPPCFVNPFIGDYFVVGFYNEDFRSVLGKPEKLYPISEGE